METLADAEAIVEAYTFRWLVERSHYVLKSGCQVEELQLETAERLERAFATSCIVAWRLLWLTYLARAEPEAPGRLELSEAEWQVLVAMVPSVVEQGEPTVREVVRAIAKLGGFIGRTRDGEPGVKTLWRGLTSLRAMVLGWEAHQALISSARSPLTRCG